MAWFPSGAVAGIHAAYQPGPGNQYKTAIRGKLDETFNGVEDVIKKATGIDKGAVDHLGSSVSKAKQYLDHFLCDDVLKKLQRGGDISGKFASASEKVKGIIMDERLVQFEGAQAFAESVLDKVNVGIEDLKKASVDIYASITKPHDQ